MARLQVTITRHLLADLFDAAYETGCDDGASFSWSSPCGAEAFERLKGKNIVFLRHCESTYQVGKAAVGETIRADRAYTDAKLTEKGKVQAAAVAVRLAQCGFRPDLIASSPLTRCLETAALAFPDQFVAFGNGVPRTAAVVVVSTLLPEIVRSWADTGRPLGLVCTTHPQLERFRGTESGSRFQHVGCQLHQAVRPCRWTEQPGGNPVEERASALLRAGLVWRWLAEPSRKERNIAVVTHSKLIKKSGKICMLGPSIDEIDNGDVVFVCFDSTSAL